MAGFVFCSEAWNLSKHRNDQKKLGSIECRWRDCFLLLCFQDAVPVGNAVAVSLVLRMQSDSDSTAHSSLLLNLQVTLRVKVPRK